VHLYILLAALPLGTVFHLPAPELAELTQWFQLTNSGVLNGFSVNKIIT